MLTLGALGWAEGDVLEPQIATFTTQVPRSQNGVITVSATDTVLEFDLQGGLASAACFPAGVALFVDGVAPSHSDVLDDCWSSTKIGAILPDISDDAAGAIGELRDAVAALSEGASAVKSGIDAISLGKAILSGAQRNLTAPSSNLAAELLSLGCQDYDAWLFGISVIASSDLPPCTQATFAPWSGAVAGGSSVKIALDPNINIRSAGIGGAIHVLLGLPTILVHECWPASMCSGGHPTLSHATITAQDTALTLPSGADTYIFGYANGGKLASGPLEPDQIASVTDADGYTPDALALTSSNSASYNTSTEYHEVAGVGVSNYGSEHTYTGSNGGPDNLLSASVRFHVSEPNSMVVIVALGGGFQCQTLTSNLPGGLAPDASVSMPYVATIAHAYPSDGSYTVTEKTRECYPGQDPRHSADLIGAFVFTPSG